MIPPDEIGSSRIRLLNDRPVLPGRYVLYWMQQSQRAEWNHALEYAVETANHSRRPLVVVFGLFDRYPEANLRHFTFMLEGLVETARALEKRGIPMVLRRGVPPDIALTLGQEASQIVCDRGYLRHQRLWREMLAQRSPCRVVQVESDVVVPVETASPKAEIGARTLRPRINRTLSDFLKPLSIRPAHVSGLNLSIEGLPLHNPPAILSDLNIDRSVPPVSRLFRGGTAEAKRRFNDFLQNGLEQYERHHNQPQTDDVSHMSPYLHFGQISPLYLLAELNAVSGPSPHHAAFAEEMVVRRELACNFTHYTADYDTFDCLPRWAHLSLDIHRHDSRPVLYNLEQLENAHTHDIYWNAAMREMRLTGFMHNHMRMYWGKKILEWSRTPEEAFSTALTLNNRYFLDGRDPNSFAGVGWVFGLHDRAWPERPIYGKIRTMTASGLERKCDISGYIRKVDSLSATL